MLVVHAHQEPYIATSVYMPARLILKARELGINRSAVYRKALTEEIERITKAEAPKICTPKASATPHEARYSGSGNQ